MENQRSNNVNPFNSLSSILVLVLVFVALFFIARSVFTILSWIAPVLLILTLIIDYKTVIDYGKWIWNLLNREILMGIGAILLTVFGFPVIAGFLFAKALFRRKVKQVEANIQETQEGEFVDYEEVESKTYKKVELPPLEKKSEPKPEPRRDKNDYEEFFE